MSNVVCWIICVCLFFQSITGKSIDFNSRSLDAEDKLTLLTPDAQENEQITDDRLSNGGLQEICKYFKTPINQGRIDPYLKCIQELLGDTREIKLVKRNVENENTVQEGLKDSANGNQTTSPGKEEVPAEMPSTTKKVSEEPIIPAVIAAENSPAISSISTSTKMNETLSNSDNPSKAQSLQADEKATEISLTTEKSIIPAVIVPENSLQKGSVPTTEPTPIKLKGTSLGNSGKEENPISVSSTSEALSQAAIIPAVIVPENSLQKESVPATEPTTSTKIKGISLGNSGKEENPISVSPTTEVLSQEVIPSTETKITGTSSDKPLSNEGNVSHRVLHTPHINLINMALNPETILNSGDNDNQSSSSIDLTTDAPVLFKNGFDEILKNAPGKQHNISIEGGDGPSGTLEMGQKQNVVLQAPKNGPPNAIEGGEISKAGESQEKTSSSPSNILLIIFAALGIVGTLAFAFNYIKKRREDREVNEMIKLEEEGRELKEVKPLIKSRLQENGAKSLEYIDADPQIVVEKETRAETDQYLENGKETKSQI